MKHEHTDSTALFFILVSSSVSTGSPLKFYIKFPSFLFFLQIYLVFVLGNATVTRSTARPMRRVIKPKKKPMTYSEQLKALQPPKELYRTGTGRHSLIDNKHRHGEVKEHLPKLQQLLRGT